MLASKCYAFLQQCQRADAALRHTYLKIEPEQSQDALTIKPHNTYAAAPKNRNKLLVSVEKDCNESIKIVSVREEMGEESLDAVGELVELDGEMEDEHIEYVTVMVSENDYDELDQVDVSMEQAEEPMMAEGDGEVGSATGDTEYVLDDDRPRRRKARQNFKCDQCGKVLSNFGSYKYHLQLHSDATPFRCNKCDASFKTKNAFDGHMMTHDPNNPHTCHICGKKYRQAASLEGHLRSHTGEKVIFFDSLVKDVHLSDITKHIPAISVRHLR